MLMDIFNFQLSLDVGVAPAYRGETTPTEGDTEK